MIVEMKTGATKEEIDAVVQKVYSYGWDVQMNVGTEKTVIAILGSTTGQVSSDIFAVLSGVESVTRIMKPYKLASREVKAEDSLVSINGLEIGGKRIIVMAGPCAECKRHKGALLRTVLEQERPLVSHVITDSRSAGEACAS